MNWFGRKAAQVAARPALSRVYGSWSAPAPLSYEAQLREGYLGNAIVQRAVRLVAEAAGSAPLAASDPSLAALVAATSGGQGLIETLAAQLLLHGNGYVQILADGAFIGGRLIVREAQEVQPIGIGPVRLSARPVVAVDAVTLLARDSETMLQEGDYRVAIAPDGRARLTIGAPGDAKRVRVAYRAGIAGEPSGVPEAIRHGIIRMTQHLYAARDGAGIAPPAAIAALWQPWRRLTLGGER